MDKLKRKLEELAAGEPMHKNCHIKIRRSEVSAPTAFMKGKEEARRLLAIELLEILNGSN